MAHGLGGTKTMRLDDYAARFAIAGYACLVFDYRHFGASDGVPRQLLSVRRQLADWAAAIAYARSLPEIDADRVVVWGTSFGGGHALTMASRDHRIVAAIAQCPFTDGLASALTVDRGTSMRVTAYAIRDRIGAALGFEPLYLPTAARPGTPSFMSAPDALPGLIAISARSDDAENRLTARSAIDIFSMLLAAKLSVSSAPSSSRYARPTLSPPSKSLGGKLTVPSDRKFQLIR